MTFPPEIPQLAVQLQNQKTDHYGYRRLRVAGFNYRVQIWNNGVCFSTTATVDYKSVDYRSSDYDKWFPLGETDDVPFGFDNAALELAAKMIQDHQDSLHPNMPAA